MRMKHILRMIIVLGSATLAGACSNPGQKAQDDFKYTIDSFADLKVMRYRIPGWENLSLQQKEYAFHLAEAAKYGRDILWDQNCKDNLRVRHALEAILETDKEDSQEWQDFMVYAKRVFFSNGIHHHYAEDKIFPACPREYFASLLKEAGIDDPELLDIIYTKPFPNRFCAQYAKFIGEHLDFDPYFPALVEDAFTKFFDRIVTHYPDYRKYTVNAVGSVAYHFSPILEKVVERYGMKMGIILPAPMDGLVKYHTSC